MYSHSTSERWKKSSPEIFWGEIAPCDHVVQIYEDDHVFLELLYGFTVAGFSADESVIIIATGKHLQALDQKLKTCQHDVFSLKLKDQLIMLDAEELLAQFMINHWPDEILFRHVVSGLLNRAKNRGRRVRAFGEMVAILWAQGHNGATVHLENLWSDYCAAEAFSLFCAYPRIGFTQDASASLLEICTAHSKIISKEKHDDVLFYKELSYQKTG